MGQDLGKKTFATFARACVISLLEAETGETCTSRVLDHTGLQRTVESARSHKRQERWAQTCRRSHVFHESFGQESCVIRGGRQPSYSALSGVIGGLAGLSSVKSG
ncbi:unnamed protein product [Symbiodinium natans]|uniref:Uncharacterized protein n=1 Tax=Symbiodinium natans TaxID=878477 RepID=A0A812P6E6_9DINO|nr:unnamed protein product [Symbiodinium natans]